MKKAHMLNTILIGALLVVTASAAVTYASLVALNTTAESKSAPDFEQDQEYRLTRYLLFREDTKDNLIALLKFVSNDDWKWNEKFPSKFEVKDKELHAVLNKHIKQVTGKRTEVALDVAMLKGKPRPFLVIGTWSMCNSTTCKVFKREINF